MINSNAIESTTIIHSLGFWLNKTHKHISYFIVAQYSTVNVNPWAFNVLMQI